MNKWQDEKFLKTLSPKALETLATRYTGIKPNKGTNKDRKAGRSKGRYLKGQL
jgi:hypothetical protein